MSPRRVHFKKEDYDIYIGRPSKYGNPFSHKTSIAKYKVSSKSISLFSFYQWVMADQDFVQLIKKELRGKILGCWCEEGEPCHGDILLSIANDLPLPWFLFPKNDSTHPSLF